MPNKLTSITGFGEGDPKPDKSDGVVSRIKKAGSEYSPKHALYSKEGFKSNQAKNKAIHAKTGGKSGLDRFKGMKLSPCKTCGSRNVHTHE